MSNADAARREAYRTVAETCPKVDRALDVAADEIKQQTGDLRDALIQAIEERMDAESENETLRERVAELEAEVESLQMESAK